MTTEQTPPGTPPPPASGSQQTELAGLRTSLSAERSLMSWVRTGLSLISFGFTSYKFLQALQENRPEPGLGPRRMGILLLALGALCGVVGFTDYVRTMHKIQAQLPTPIAWFPAFVSLAVAALGGLMIVGIAIRVGVF